MRDFAPEIYRQRLVIEGIFTSRITTSKLREYLARLSERLGMTIIYGPVVKNLAGKVNPIHKGLEAVMIWAESGVSVYTWKKQKFFTVDIYSCKQFDAEKAVGFTGDFFEASAIDFRAV